MAELLGGIHLPWVDHDWCTWEQVGRCVYCREHGVKLYQGKLPPKS